MCQTSVTLITHLAQNLTVSIRHGRGVNGDNGGGNNDGDGGNNDGDGGWTDEQMVGGPEEWWVVGLA